MSLDWLIKHPSFDRYVCQLYLELGSWEKAGAYLSVSPGRLKRLAANQIKNLRREVRSQVSRQYWHQVVR